MRSFLLLFYFFPVLSSFVPTLLLWGTRSDSFFLPSLLTFMTFILFTSLFSPVLEIYTLLYRSDYTAIYHLPFLPSPLFLSFLSFLPSFLPFFFVRA